MALVFASSLRAQVAGNLDTAFSVGTGPNDIVLGLATQPDGKTLLVGWFTSVNGIARNGIARLNPDGSVESAATFNLGNSANGRISRVALQTDGKILIGGDFTTVNGQPRSKLARLNPDGSLESTATFKLGAGLNGGVLGFAVQPDGKILIAGSFGTVDGQPRNFIARLNPDGTLESEATFHPGTGPNGSVFCVVVQSDGKILLGGSFSSFDGQPRNNIARLEADGTVERTATFDSGNGANGGLVCIALQADAKLLIGGYFTSVDDQPRNRIARLLPNGSLESASTFDTGAGPSGGILSAAVQTDGKILLGGTFSSVDGQPRNNIARLLSNGTVESTATFDTGSGISPPTALILSVPIAPNGAISIGGFFTNFNGQPRPYFTRLLNDPVSQRLSILRRSRVLWERGGAGPEVDYVAFEVSTNGGASWSLLGMGTRAAGGWELTGVELPTFGKLRAIGRTSDGGKSSGFVATAPVEFSYYPEIAVEQPPGNGLISGASSFVDFGVVADGSSSSRTFTIRNNGAVRLTGLGVTLADGNAAGDFSEWGLGATELAPGAETTFCVALFPSTTGQRTATLRIVSNDEDENPFEIYLSGRRATLIDAWRQTYFGSTANTGAGADLSDPDRDGVVNLMEFATGSGPWTVNGQPGELVKNGGSLEFTWPRRKAALAEISYAVEWSETLAGSWSAAGVSTAVFTDGSVMQQMKSTLPAGGSGLRFVRLRVMRL